MKKILFTIVLAAAIGAGSRMGQMNSAAAQGFTSPFTPLTNSLVNPLTNNLGFTNTLVQLTNVSQIEMTDVVTILLSLQTNIEVTLPVLSFLTTNASAAAPTNVATGAFMPITTAPGGLLTPTGAATGTGGQQPTSISMRVGTNVFTLDPSTFQALVELQGDLARALPVLQALNGTSPTNAPTAPVAPSTSNAVTQPPFSNGFFTPLTNGPPPLVRGF